jgi:transposase-like protein
MTTDPRCGNSTSRSHSGDLPACNDQAAPDTPTHDHAKCARTKIRDGKVANRPIYVALAVTCEGRRDILGLWAGEAPSVTGSPVGEGAKYWLHVLTEIRNRGVGDVLMVVCDGLTGLPDAISAVWPQTIAQTCVVHYAGLRLMPRSRRDPSRSSGFVLARSA